MSIEDLAVHQRAIVDAWWEAMPRSGWVMSYITWARVVNATSRDLIAVRDDGSEVYLAFPEPLSERIAAYREALSDPEGGWPIAIEMRMDAHGSAQMRVVWNDRVWFGLHPGAPLQPNPDPTVPEVPNAEMWRLELELHPRAADRVPDWWRSLIELGDADNSVPGPLQAGQAEQTEQAGHSSADPGAASAPVPPLAVDDIDGALRAPVTLPAAHRIMVGAWGWDVVYEQVNETVVETLRGLGDEARGSLFGADDDRRRDAVDAVIDAADDRVRTELREEWFAATPIRLLREWNERHGQPDPQGLGAVDPAARFADEVVRSYPLKQAEARLNELVREVVERNLRDRLFGAGA
ncbi:hypothetical protein GCM10011490_03020 [Pseudoclavibacter endophyticus]|uniref:Uncharacterized protein n=1 Tax=Pseudoclavibacter endophyticus TaxID=1778590 RepID=A0A6H9WPW1_9MICO|nr:hypothetical protein [Pseudoclavibacter endophyticus]KAB1650168.1 hypothetical protein F8O04_08200 [Pseudoclavibacter endophyticus]GGA56565.1 hypothetical protein GCM10011490_03020 [Pseudoclavibacter endophyticus]